MDNSKLEEYKKLIESVKLMRELKPKTVEKNNNIFDYCIFMIVLMCFMVLISRLIPTHNMSYTMPICNTTQPNIVFPKYNQFLIKY